jgi:hypothetical protein
MVRRRWLLSTSLPFRVVLCCAHDVQKQFEKSVIFDLSLLGW